MSPLESPKVIFLTSLAKTLHRCGMSTHELESQLSFLSDSLGIDGSFLITPTSVSMTLEQGLDTYTKNLRLFPAVIDIAKLNRSREVAQAVAMGELDPGEGIETLEEIERTDSIYPLWLKVLSFGIVGSCLPLFLGGNYYDCAAAGCAGLVAGAGLYGLSGARIEPIKDALISFLVTCLIFGFKAFVPEINVLTAAIASLIIMIPGLSLTIAVSELANKHISAGTARLMGAVVDFFKLGAGLVAGHQIARNFGLTTEGASGANPSLWLISFAVIICSFATSAVFNARKGQLPWICACSLWAIGFLRLMDPYLSANVSIFFAALGIGLFSNIYAIRTNQTVATLLLPSIVFLVPGAIGLKGLQLLLNNNLAIGAEESMRTVIVAVLIVGGLFFADAFTPFRSPSKR